MILSLSGFMGCGKSTVGRELAKALGCPFVDLDEHIVSREGRSIPAIFASGGESAFRAIEAEALREVLEAYSKVEQEGLEGDGGGVALGSAGDKERDGAAKLFDGARPDLVLALGGGTLTTPECRELVKAHCKNIYLRSSAETLRARLEGSQGRPLLTADFEKLLSSRIPIYEECADVVIESDLGSVEEIVKIVVGNN